MRIDNARYEERCPEVSAKSKQTRTAKMIRQFRALGYRVELTNRVEPTNLPAGNQHERACFRPCDQLARFSDWLVCPFRDAFSRNRTLQSAFKLEYV